jgi:hypothetical protein
MPNPATPWTNQPLRIYHGTLVDHAMYIMEGGADVGRGRERTDFGKGFYATADARQAADWAIQLAARKNGTAVVVYTELDREDLAKLDSLVFIRGHADAYDYWSFVQHCRTGAGTHGRRLPGKPLYDVVIGPVSRNYARRTTYEDMDQISFHTAEAQEVLNRVPWEGYDPTR